MGKNMKGGYLGTAKETIEISRSDWEAMSTETRLETHRLYHVRLV